MAKQTTSNDQVESAADDDSLYENMDGAQTGGTRAFNATTTPSHGPNAELESAAISGRPDTQLPHSENQGITNHSANEESARNQKVVDERADAQAGGGSTL